MTPDAVRALSTGLFIIVISLTLGMAAWHIAIAWTNKRREQAVRILRVAAAVPFYVVCYGAAVCVIPFVCVTGLTLELGNAIRGQSS